MMTNTFGFGQSNDGTTQIARITVPGCGRNEKQDAPIILVERDHDGKATLFVYADILSKEATHEIPLDGARIEKLMAVEVKDATVTPATPGQ